jgi:aspartate 1-decarboxylase
VEYEGSLTLDADLMQAADLLPYERIEVYDVDNAQRFSTYLIPGERGQGDCCVNGAAARLVERGHRLILAAYASLDASELAGHRPRIVWVGPGNRIRRTGDQERAQTRASDQDSRP